MFYSAPCSQIPSTCSPWWSSSWCSWGETMSLKCSHQLAYWSSPGNTWAWRIMVEWYQQGETPDSATRALCQSYEQSHLVAKQEKLGKGNYEFGLMEYLCSCFKGIFNIPEENKLLICITLKNPSPSRGIESANLESSDKQASHYITQGNYVCP
jgi:hypothetical protein